VVNHNVLLDTKDVNVAKDIAKCVRETGGGLKSVQAMGLVSKDGVEVACNLLDEHESSSDKVDEMIRQLALECDVKVLKSYQTGKSVQDLLRLQDVWMNIDERV
jgi:glutamate formiminotransferase